MQALVGHHKGELLAADTAGGFWLGRCAAEGEFALQAAVGFEVLVGQGPSPGDGRNVDARRADCHC